MNWKLQTGILLNRTEQALIKSNITFINNNFPFGRDWMFDVKRTLTIAPGVIVDAGANIGSISKGLNYWFPDAEIFAFEPVSDTYRQLEKNTQKIKAIHTVKLALGSENMTSEIYLNEEHTINSLMVNPAPNSLAKKEQISIVRLDHFLQESNLHQVDILKIDVEGFEFEVLKGCGTFLDNDIKVVYLEVGYERELTKVHFSDVEVYMESKGFVLCGIYETRRNWSDRRRLWYSNNLYIKRTLLIS